MVAQVTLKSLAQGSLVRAVVDATARLPAKQLQSPGRLRILLELLADKELPTSDPLAKARLRGALAMRELLSADGGAYSASDVAALLAISRQAVDKRRKAGQLLAVALPKRGLLYPAWQFGDSGVVSGFVETLAHLADHDPWAQARFFVTGNHRCKGKRPIDLLRAGTIDAVVAAARVFGEHGAA
jgi:hypothetical protein